MKTIILDAGAAARLLHKHNNAPRLTPTRCTECGRVFDLANETDAAEWALGHDCEVFPTQYELKALKLAAEVACTNRGHEMVWHDTIGNTNIAECKHCEAWVQVNTSPAPNQIDIGGPAVALDCKE